MSYHDKHERNDTTAVLPGSELGSLKSMDEVRRLLSLLYRPKARPRRVLDADDFDGQHMELDTHLSVLQDLGQRLSHLTAPETPNEVYPISESREPGGGKLDKQS